MKKRQELPNFAKLNWKADIEKLKSVISDNLDLMIEYRDFLNAKCDTFSTHSNNYYRQVPITELNPDSKHLIRRDGHRDYNGDERNYTKLVDWAKGTYIEELLSRFKGQTTRCRLLITEPKGFILPHMDYNTSYSIRFHIPIQTNEWSFFGIQREKEKPELKHLDADGSIWFINQGWKHSAWNFGDTQRIHMVISVMDQIDLEDLE